MACHECDAFLTRLAHLTLVFRKLAYAAHKDQGHEGDWECCEQEPCKEYAYHFHYAGTGEPPRAGDEVRRKVG
jgi:hypothetical protein